MHFNADGQGRVLDHLRGSAKHLKLPAFHIDFQNGRLQLPLAAESIDRDGFHFHRRELHRIDGRGSECVARVGARHVKGHLAFFRAHGSLHDIEVRIRTAAGRQRNVLLSIDSLQLGDQCCLISSLYDISERKQSELALQATTQQMKDLSRRLVAIQEAERRNVARELHDEIGQMLTGLNLMLEAGGTFSHAALLARLHEAQTLVTDLTTRVRRLSLDLRPSMLDDFGLSAALAWLVKEVSKTSGIEVTSSIDEAVDQLPDAHRTCIYRLVQEALTNVARHSGARSVQITVRADENTVIGAVTDDGSGFDVGSIRRTGLGLLGMEERVRELGGTLRIQSNPGRGTRVELRLPRPAMAAVAGPGSHASMHTPTATDIEAGAKR